MSKTGSITKEKLGQFAKNVLDLLEKEEINLIGDLFPRLGKNFNIKNSDHFIQIDSRPSEPGTRAYAIAYITPNGGIPVEIRINSYLKYSKIFVKAESKLDTYVSVAFDYFGNIIQSKKIDKCSIPIIKKELEELVS